MKVDLYCGGFSNQNCHSAKSLIETFKEYKQNNRYWSFGRDVPYHRPPSVTEFNLRHVHLLTLKDYREYEQVKKELYHRTSDKHLVYASSPYDYNHYLLIAIIDPQAHFTAQNLSFMRGLVDICNDHFG
ncbi:type II toxin-antitoxin system YafO family toxin [Alkalimonas sp. NCh-2]|uniref:type II toxin-antitoxin system YafO family toxin n=1 Tax=Alkalimonas sp. NCh-2 TaxID=3144846 RepID=UPI0031F69C63